MAVTTMTQVSNILKEIYEGTLRDQINSEVKTLRRVEKTSEGVTDDVGGKYVTFPVRTSRNHGIGARNENEALPAARAQGYASARVSLKNLYGSIQVTGQVMKLAKTNAQAFANAVDQEIDGLKEGLAKDVNRQVYGTSIGKIATTNASGNGGGTTMVMSNAEAIYLEKDMILDVYQSNDTLRGSAVVISNIQKDTPSAGSTTVTVSAIGSQSVSGDYVVRDDNRAKELIGFREFISNTGTVFNIDPSVEPLWKSEVDSTGGSLSEGLMIDMADRIADNGGGVPTVIFTTRGVRKQYFNLLVQQREIVNTQKFEGGFTGLAFATDDGEIPVVVDRDCPRGFMFMPNEKQIKLYQAADWAWMEEDGAMWTRVIGVSGSTVNYFDAYTATMFKYCEIGTHRRNSHGVISGLTE